MTILLKYFKKILLVLAITSMFMVNAVAGTIQIPANTKIYVETLQEVVGKKKNLQKGQFVRASVWRDVVVNGATVIRAGTPVLVRVDSIKGPKVAGIKGKLSLGAYETTLVNNQPLQLTGGYQKKGKGRIALSATLAAVIFLPLIFIPGKKAKLPAGTVFDAYTDRTITVNVDSNSGVRTINLSGVSEPLIQAEVLYDEILKQEKPTVFPFKIVLAGRESPTFKIDVINGKQIDPIDLKVISTKTIDNTTETYAEVKIKRLAKEFQKGINTIEVSTIINDARVSEELILDIQF